MRALLEWTKKEPGLTVRVSEVNVEPQTMLDIMNKNGFAARSGHLVPACLVFEGVDGGKSFRGSPAKLPGFDDGFFVVQDEAAAFVSLVVAPKKAKRLSTCAAPGGKTVHSAEMLENTGRVVAVDKHEARLKLVNDARLKQGLTNLETVAADGREFQLDRLCRQSSSRRTLQRYRRDQQAHRHSHQSRSIRYSGTNRLAERPD